MAIIRIREAITVVVGHVDVGKTLLLDKIRNTAVAYREPGMITQHIGMSYVPWSAVERIAGPLIDRMKLRGKIWLPGFLFIDTPGHAAFSNLRRRGGSVADVAILVVDITSGLEEQGIESLRLLQARGVPFIIAANKLDRIYGWKSAENGVFLFNLDNQDWHAISILEERIGKLIDELSQHGIEADRYDRVTDFTRQIPIVPTSALTGEGIPDLLVVLAGLAQRLVGKERLTVHDVPARGVIMEVSEMRGLGPVIDVVLYDGVLRRGDTVVTMGIDGPLTTTVKAIIATKPLDEMRDPEDRYRFVDEVVAAIGVRLVAEGVDRAVPGAPIIVVRGEAEAKYALKEITEEVGEFRLATDREGVVAKADTFGTLESMVLYLKQMGIPVRVADIGNVTRRDVLEAHLAKRRNPVYGVVLAFNVKVPPEVEKEAQSMGVKIFRGEILYRIVEEYAKWAQSIREHEIREMLASVVHPGKIQILPGFVFRRSDPVIVGVKVLGGVIKPGYQLVKPDGREVGRIMQIQKHGKPIPEARMGDEVAISIEGKVIVGRHIDEGDILYVLIPDEHYRKLITQLKQYLTEDEKALLNEYAELRRKWASQR